MGVAARGSASAGGRRPLTRDRPDGSRARLACVELEDGLVDGFLLVGGVVVVVPAGQLRGAFVVGGVLVGLVAGGDLGEGPPRAG